MDEKKEPDNFDIAYKAIQDRFSQPLGKPPTTDQQELVGLLRGVVMDLGLQIELRVPNGRNKSLALTALEDVQMRANRAIFDPTNK